MGRLISDEYIRLNSELHSRDNKFGGRVYKWLVDVLALIKSLDIKSVLDYGAGKGMLKIGLSRYKKIYKFKFSEYDPAVSGKEKLPKPAELVVCTDVLEHVEPNCLKNVFHHVFDLTERYAFVTIALRKGKKKLANGQFAHINLHSKEEWDDLLRNILFEREDKDKLLLERIVPRLKNREKRDAVYLITRRK